MPVQKNDRMTRITCLFTCLFLLAGCSHKTIPSAGKLPVKPLPPPQAGTPEKKIAAPAITAPPTVAATIPAPKTAKKFQQPLVVIDDRGEIITPASGLPEAIAAKVNYRSIARAYTPDQRKNLIFRFKMVPPRVLYIPPELASHSTRGTYCVFRKKFWYWQKEDGLFYIDETYYQ
ncbi:MAG TPA: hypothetical protein VG842_08965 [Sediminibacterium sp.]|nr:hypothetical protein [Sediminibacterium sp.]